jgi:hypothetical protein
VLFSLGIIVILFGIWWNSFRWEELDIWTYLEYSLLCVYMSAFYAMAVILHPGNSRVVPRFDEIRTPFYVAFILYLMIECVVVYVRDGSVETAYLVVIGPFTVLAGIGIYLRKIRFDQFLAALNLLISVGWQIVARWVGCQKWPLTKRKFGL